MDEDLLQKTLQAVNHGQRFAFATIIESTLKGTPRKTGAKMLVLEDGTIWGTIGGGRNEKAAQQECLKAIKTQKPACLTYSYFGGKGQSICGGQIKVFIEPFVGKKHLIICGGGHIALPLSALGKILGFKVTVIDNRREFASKRRFPHIDQVIFGPYAERLKQVTVTPDTFIVIVTQGNEGDFESLKIAIRSPAAYIGVISSAAKRIKFFKKLKEEGVPEKDLKRIQAPMGVDIGAQTPQEIAVSIAAELVSHLRKPFLGTVKFSQK